MKVMSILEKNCGVGEFGDVSGCHPHLVKIQFFFKTPTARRPWPDTGRSAVQEEEGGGGGEELQRGINC